MTRTKELIQELAALCIKKQIWLEYRPLAEYLYYIDHNTFIQLNVRSVDKQLLIAIEKVNEKEDSLSLIF